MAPLLLELSRLEVESLEVVAAVSKPEGSLETLTTANGEVGIVSALAGNGISFVNEECCGFCGCGGCCGSCGSCGFCGCGGC
jgi:hypothetical protein